MNEVDKGEWKEGDTISLKTGDKIEIVATIKSDEASIYRCLGLNGIVEYNDSNNKKHTEYFTITQQGIANKESGMAVMKQLVSAKKEQEK